MKRMWSSSILFSIRSVERQTQAVQLTSGRYSRYPCWSRVCPGVDTHHPMPACDVAGEPVYEKHLNISSASHLLFWFLLVYLSYLSTSWSHQRQSKLLAVRESIIFCCYGKVNPLPHQPTVTQPFPYHRLVCYGCKRCIVSLEQSER